MLNCRVADFARGFYWGAVGGDSEKHVAYQQTIYINGSLFVARSLSNPRFGESTGLLFSNFASQGYSISPTIDRASDNAMGSPPLGQGPRS